MAKLKVLYDREGRTLTVWFGNPESEALCEEADDDTILMKDARGEIIGFEKLNVPAEVGDEGVSVELIARPGAGR